MAFNVVGSILIPRLEGLKHGIYLSAYSVGLRSSTNIVEPHALPFVPAIDEHGGVCFFVCR